MKTSVPKNKVFLQILFCFLLLPTVSYTSGILKGKIVDATTAEPLPAANVQILGTTKGASTDADGNFNIKKLLPGLYTVRASMIGYRTETLSEVRIRDGETTELEFRLVETAIEFDPIVVLAGKSRQRLDQAAVSISVVTSKDIERRNPTNLIEALEAAPGVHFIGNQINIRGSTGYTFGAGNKVLLLLDGVPVYASDTGEFNWDMLPPLDIEQIEVLKGAGSTLWGASALGGVVNVITKNPSPEGKLLFSWSAGKYDEPYYDEWNWSGQNQSHYTREDVSFSKQFGSLGMRISAGHLMSTGYRELGDMKKYNLTAKFDYRFPNSIKWTGYVAYSDIHKGFFVQWKGQNDPYEVDESNLDNYADTDQITIYTKVAIPFSSRFALNIRGSLVRTLMGNQFGSGNDFNPAMGQGFEIQADYIPHINHTITSGIQFQHDAGSTKYFGDHTGSFIGLYLQDEWRMRHNLRMTTGLRYDRYQLIGDAREDLFSPRFGVNWQPWTTTSVRASVGSGFRAATIVERFLELSVMNFKIKSNPDIKAESSWAFDVGLRQYITKNWNVDVSFFDNEYWELIEAHLDLIRGQIQFRNIPRARIQGVEMTTNVTFPFRAFGTTWIPGLKASITALDHENIEYNEPLTYRPKILANIKTLLNVGSAQLQIDYRYASKIDEVKLYPINQRVPMKFVDVRFSYEFWHLTFKCGIINLFQYNYAPMESNLMPMRTFTVGAQGEF